jgi:hypothetical protein
MNKKIEACKRISDPRPLNVTLKDVPEIYVEKSKTPEDSVY